MEPVTHALTSLALSRAGLDRTASRAVLILLAGGLLPDLDLLTLFFGPHFILRWNGALTHSLLGCGLLVLLIALAFWFFGRNHPKYPIRFSRALLLAAIGAAAHLLLDLSDSFGVRLLWPFHQKWFAWFLAQAVDPWILLLLLFGVLLPSLFHLVSEEIGERKKKRAGRSAIVWLVLVVLYLAGRDVLRSRANEELLAREYHGAAPVAADAFPTSASPLLWRGVVDTANTLEVVDVPFSPGSYFDPERSVSHFKPDSSPALDAANRTATVRRFLRFARYPLASLDRTETGWHFELRDLRFASRSSAFPAIIAVVDLDASLHVTREELQFESAARR